MRRTKIVATVGPATSTSEGLRSLIDAGADVFRLNFSHEAREAHRTVIKRIRQVSAECGVEVAILQDLGGPKIRTGDLGCGVELETGSPVTIAATPVEASPTLFSTTYADLARDVRSGDRILLDDGAMELRVREVHEGTVECHVVQGGLLRSRKGMNLPDSPISAPPLTPKDLEDLEVGIQECVDFVALSFVRSPDEVMQLRGILSTRNCPAQVIAKIERPEALEQIEAITEAAHGILVARGDLGVEMDLARVPLLQKDIIRTANEQEKYVIVATQMLESMVTNPGPTRAEVSDITNAILDGTDAVMLSAETSVGRYPTEAVRFMARVACQTEQYAAKHPPPEPWSPVNPTSPVQDAVGRAAFVLCRDLEARAIAAFSATGGTALFLSKRRPSAPILAFTARLDALRRMRLFWGVSPVLDTGIDSKESLVATARTYLREHGWAEPHASVVVVAGTRFGQVASTNGVEVFEC